MRRAVPSSVRGNHRHAMLTVRWRCVLYQADNAIIPHRKERRRLTVRVLKAVAQTRFAIAVNRQQITLMIGRTIDDGRARRAA